MQTAYQPILDPIGAEPTRPRQYQPYRPPRIRVSANEQINAEAGPSTLTPPSIPSVGPPTTQPSGRLFGMTAVAERGVQNTEENKTPVSDFYRSRIRRASDWSFSARSQKGQRGPATRENLPSIALGFKAEPTHWSGGPTSGRGPIRASMMRLPVSSTAALNEMRHLTPLDIIQPRSRSSRPSVKSYTRSPCSKR